MLMTTGGLSIRIKASDVRETGRSAQGVKLLSLKEGESLQDIALVVPDADGSSEDSEGEDSEEAGESNTDEAADTSGGEE